MKDVEYRTTENGRIEVHVIDDVEGSEKLCYLLDKKNKIVEFYPNDEKYFVNVIYLEGFTDIPSEFSDKGYILGKVTYYLNALFKDKNIAKFTISKENKQSYRKTKKGYSVTVPYSEFSKYKNEMVSIDTESKVERKRTTNDFFATLFPKYFTMGVDSVIQKKKRFISGLDVNIIPNLSSSELAQLQEFVFDILDKKYIDVTKKLNLITTYKNNIETLVVDEAIKGFEENLAKEANESEWGKFIQKYMFLVETKYVKVIPELNLSLASWRKVDFAYIDNQNYLDIFEIKKPQTKLLCKNDDRGNYYWHTETVKAITQAEKYLFSAERKAPELVEDIRRENGTDVIVIKPRAFLIIGSSSQLINENMKQDFRILRNSLKNIEIITYDEFFDRLKMLKSRTFC